MYSSYQNGTSYMTSTTGFTTLNNAYMSPYAVTPHGGALTSQMFRELKQSPLQQHLKTIPKVDETNRGANNRSLMTVSVANSTPTKQNYGGYINLSSLSAVAPMCE